MKENIKFKSRSEADAFRSRLKSINRAAFTSCCIVNGNKYNVQISGDFTPEQIQQARQRF